MSQDALFIGGPKDGQTLRVMPGKYEVQCVDASPHRGLTKTEWERISLPIHRYKLETIRTPQGDVTFYLHESITPLDALTKLLARYGAVTAASLEHEYDCACEVCTLAAGQPAADTEAGA